MTDSYKMEQKIARIKRDILAQAQKAYAECKETKDWKAYDIQMSGLYKSYATCDDEAHIRAIRDIIAGTENVEEEILGGNCGFRAQASKLALEQIENTKLIKSKLGSRAAKTYTRGLNECEAYALAVVASKKKEVGNFFQDVIDVTKANG